MQAENDSIKVLHEYFRNNYYKNIIALSLILMFSIVFNLIYLIIDSFLDKDKHYKLALKACESYEASKRKQMQSEQLVIDNEENNYELEKKNATESTNNSHLDFAIWSHRNLQISFIHSFLCSLWLVQIVVCRHEGLFNDPLLFVSWDTYLLVAFSCGYFLYDLYDIYANGYFKIEWVVCAHHIIVLLSFTYHMTHLLSVGYTVIALFMEFNSVFLHARKLLKFYGYKNDDFLVRLNKALNIISFILFRFGVLIKIFVALYHDGHRTSIYYMVFLTTCIALMTVINIVLFKRLVMKDIFYKKKDNTSYNQAENNGPSSIKLLDLNAGLTIKTQSNLDN